jgi:hypothetical protein
MNAQNIPTLKRVLFLTAKYSVVAYVFQCVAMFIAFLTVIPLFIIPEFYLTWATRWIVHDDMDLMRARYILLQLAINTCICAAIFAPVAYWHLKSKASKRP